MPARNRAMEGWSRDMYWDATALPWVMPVAEHADLDTAIVYPARCSTKDHVVGRGAHHPPLRADWAPWLDGDQLAPAQENKVGLSVHWPRGFEPTFQKHARQPAAAARSTSRAAQSFCRSRPACRCSASAFVRRRTASMARSAFTIRARQMPIDILAVIAGTQAATRTSAAEEDRREAGTPAGRPNAEEIRREFSCSIRA